MAAACWVAPEMLLVALMRLWVKQFCLEGSPLLSRDQWVRSVGCAALAKLSSEENNNGLSLIFLPVPNYSIKAKPTVPASLPLRLVPLRPDTCLVLFRARYHLQDYLITFLDNWYTSLQDQNTPNKWKSQKPLQGLAVAARVNKLHRQGEREHLMPQGPKNLIEMQFTTARKGADTYIPADRQREGWKSGFPHFTSLHLGCSQVSTLR